MVARSKLPKVENRVLVEGSQDLHHFLENRGVAEGSRNHLLPPTALNGLVVCFERDVEGQIRPFVPRHGRLVRVCTLGGVLLEECPSSNFSGDF